MVASIRKSALILYGSIIFSTYGISADKTNPLAIQSTSTDSQLPSARAPNANSGKVMPHSNTQNSPQALDSGIQQLAYLKASNTGSSDWFGYSVAISGDTMVVGASLEDSNATGVNNGNGAVDSAGNSGAVYVFIRTADSWTQQAYLKASNTGSSDEFGLAVAISEDTIVVGAPYEDSDRTGVNSESPDNSLASASGAVYVFVRNAGLWTQQAYLKASNTEFNDRFGMSVSIASDTLVVGAYLEDSSATGGEVDNSEENSGAAYVFTRNAGEWAQQAFLKASNAEATDYFGYSVAISDETIIVGAQNESSNATEVNGAQDNNLASFAGAAYVFTRSASSWSQQAYLKASNSGFSDRFGFSVAISGETVAISAHFEDSNETGVGGTGTNDQVITSGAAYTFTRSAGAWSQEQYFKASNTGNTDLFGYSVAISGDILLVGSRLEDSDAQGINGDGNNDLASGSGAAYSYIRQAGSWSQPTYIKASNTGEDDKFGAAVAISGTILLIGALNESSNASSVNGDQGNDLSDQSGAAYIFSISDPGSVFTNSFE